MRHEEWPAVHAAAAVAAAKREGLLSQIQHLRTHNCCFEHSAELLTLAMPLNTSAVASHLSCAEAGHQAKTCTSCQAALCLKHIVSCRSSLRSATRAMLKRVVASAFASHLSCAEAGHQVVAHHHSGHVGVHSSSQLTAAAAAAACGAG
jgi:hypothetical protein